MGDILKFKRPTLAERHKGKQLCKSGFHQWEIQQGKQFDVKLGRLVTCYRCRRCAETKVEAR